MTPFFPFGGETYKHIDLSYAELLHITPRDFHYRFFNNHENRKLSSQQTVKSLLTTSYLLLRSFNVSAPELFNRKQQWRQDHWWSSKAYNPKKFSQPVKVACESEKMVAATAPPDAPRGLRGPRTRDISIRGTAQPTELQDRIEPA
jgi:hypothetical protein